MKKAIIPLLLSLVTSVCATATTYYIWPGGRGLKTGLSWADASGDLQVMINAADSADQIWVAKGVYMPEHPSGDISVVDPGNRMNAFVLKKDVSIYGGFAGTETILEARDSLTQETVFSGDFNGDDVVAGSGVTLAFSGNGENAYHVVIAASYIGNAVLDGCRISGGNSNGTGLSTINGRTVYQDRGAGVYCDLAQLSIRNCAIVQNRAAYNGGGFYSYQSPAQPMQRCAVLNNQADSCGGGMASYKGGAPLLSECIVAGNRAGTCGGGIYGNTSGAVASDTRCVITNNYAAYGGGIFEAFGGSLLANCLVEGNTASIAGGGVYSLRPAPIYYNDCSFKNNKAVTGAGFYFSGLSTARELNFLRCTFSGNKAQSAGGGIYSWGGILNMKQCILVADTAAYGAGICAFDSYNILTDCSISRNVADSAAALHSDGTPVTGFIELSNCTVADNSAASTDCIRAGVNGVVKILNSVVWGNSGGLAAAATATMFQSYSLVQGEPGGGLYNNIAGTVDPLFVNMADGDYRLQAGSPVIDRGTQANYTGIAPVDFDLAGASRYRSDSLDLGAYEYQGLTTGIADPKRIGVALVNAYPNPATSGDVITISTTFTAVELNNAQVQLLDMSGRVVLRAAMTSPEMNLQVPDAAGAYTGRLLLSDGRAARFRVVINK